MGSGRKNAGGELGRGELDLIEQIRRSNATGGRGVALGIGDDCAILQPPRGHEVLVTTDFTLEGRHFRRDWHPARSAGHRALARGLSDLAAMGARPLAAFLSLAVPKEMIAAAAGRAWVKGFMDGLSALSADHAVPLAGGDTAESPCGLVLADIVLVGSAPKGHALRRSGGRAGDALYVTGELGGAAAELEMMQSEAGKGRKRQGGAGERGIAEHPQLWPQPRVAVGRALLARKLATAAIDLSDGLSSDLAHLCRESGLGAEVDAAALPIHPLAIGAGRDRALDFALNGGEDYELLFAVPEKVRMPRRVAGVRITRIGRLVRGSRMVLVDREGRRNRLEAKGWEHFRGAPHSRR